MGRLPVSRGMGAAFLEDPAGSTDSSWWIKKADAGEWVVTHGHIPNVKKKKIVIQN